jgi:translation elongation factor EF-1beta
VFKLIVGCVIEDDKVSTDDIEEQICEMEDMVQSVDIQSFNKL